MKLVNSVLFLSLCIVALSTHSSYASAAAVAQATHKSSNTLEDSDRVQSRRLKQSPEPYSPSNYLPQVKICIPFPVAPTECNGALSQANNNDLNVGFTCVQGSSIYDCISQVDKGTVQMAKLPSFAVYDGYKSKGLIPVVSEKFEGQPDHTASYSVALVPSKSCGADPIKYSSFKGGAGCFSSYGTSAGWYVPLGTLINEGMPIVANASYSSADAYSIGTYFSKVCAPGYTVQGPATDGKKPGKICDLCQKDCKIDDPFYNENAYMCPGDVVFSFMPGGVPDAAPPPEAPAEGEAPTTSTTAGDYSENPDAVPAGEGPDYAPAPAPGPEDGSGDAAASDYAPAPAPADDYVPLEEQDKQKSPSPSPDKSPSPNGNSRRRLLLSARSLTQSAPDLQLMCSDGTCKPTTEYETCNLAKVPSAAFVAKADWAKSDLGQRAQAALVIASTGGGQFMEATKVVGLAPNTIINPGASELVAVLGVTAEDYLGADFIKAMDGTVKAMPLDGSGLTNTKTVGGTSSSGSSGSLSTAAIVGIVIAALVGVGIIVLIGVTIYYKRKRTVGWERYQDAIREIQRL